LPAGSELAISFRLMKVCYSFAIALERLKKCCSHSALKSGEAVFLIFGFVLAQLQGFANLRLRQSLAKNQKSSLRIGYSIFLTALVRD